jgi:hypothetical protein
MRYGGYNLPATPGPDIWAHIFGINDERDLENDQSMINYMQREASNYESMFLPNANSPLGPQADWLLNILRAHMQSIDDEIERLFNKMAWRRQRRIDRR